MLKIGFVGVAAVALVTLAACGPKSGAGQPAPYSNGQAGWAAAQGGGQNQMAQNQMAQNQMAQNPMQGQQQPWQNQGGYPQQPYPQQGGGYPQAQGGYPGAMAPQGGALQVGGAPRGMRPIQSQAGYVFVTQLGGSPRASQLVEGLVQGVSDYFDRPPQIIGQQTDPSDRMSQVAFRATLHGAPVTGQIAVAGDGRSNGVGYLMFDSPERTPQTMNIMLQATRGGGY
jgi:hypothetical protein